MKVAVAGATGFVGKALLNELAKEHQVVALTRGVVDSSRQSESKISWRQCDLFSLLEAEEALAGVDVAIYLIHSMLPSAELSQGNFQDFDLLVADNFARAAEKTKLKQIIYLGGMFPENEKLSKHLASRKEVEKALASRGVPLTVLRAAMILGAEGSSTTMIIKLVERLRLMLCPSWTETVSQPVALEDATCSLIYMVGREESFNQSYDLAGPTSLTYREMILQTAKALGLNRRVFSVPVFSPVLSSFWLKLVTGAPRSLTGPLVASLKHRMVARPGKSVVIEGRPFKEFSDTIKQVVVAVRNSKGVAPRAFVLPEDERRRRTVRSVQRLVLPQEASAVEVADEYIKWLPKFLAPLLRVSVSEGLVDFRVPLVNISLLQLQFSEDRSIKNRQLFYIVGGLLAKSVEKDRIEFRETYDRENIIVAVHDFEPALPWYFYKFSQAPLHAFVMRRFGAHLRSWSVNRG